MKIVAVVVNDMSNNYGNIEALKNVSLFREML